MASPLSTNEVTVLFNGILFRAPDAGGLSYWATGLDTGTYTLAQVTTDFITSAEAQTVVDPIVWLYEAAFDRAPDVGGITNWVIQVDNGVGAQAIAQGFTGSAEFVADYGSLNSINPTTFINSLYENVLGRTSDAAGLAGWLSVLGTPTVASEAAVLQGFVKSSEFINDTQGNVNTWLTYAANSAEAGTTASTLGTPTYSTALAPL